MARFTSPKTSLLTSGGYRWRILALLFAATTINYMDRSVLGVLGPTLQYKVFHWTDQDYATVNIAFKLAYAIGFLVMGAITDRYGTKIGYTVAIVTWSLSGLLHAAVRPAFGLLGFSAARFGLGLGEAGNFPSAIKTVAEWFPRKERALATGIFNAGANVGAILAPLCIPLIVAPDGRHWQFAFLITGTFSALWIVFWWRMYRRPGAHPSVGPQELAYIQADSPDEDPAGKTVRWSRLLRYRQTWGCAVAKLTDAVWWFYLFWGGKFLYDQFGLNIKTLALPLIVIYLVADAGSVAGGWLSSYWLRQGWSVNRARKTAMLLCALCVLPVSLVTKMGTRFVANDPVFARLGLPIPTAPAQGSADALHGASFDSAKEFLAAVSVRANPAEVARWEPELIESARTDNRYWIAVLLIALAAAGHQAWSANAYTLASDLFPKRVTASVSGISGMAGAVAGILSDFGLGRVLASSGPSGYFFAFLVAGCAYLVALGGVQLLMPRMEPVSDSSL